MFCRIQNLPDSFLQQLNHFTFQQKCTRVPIFPPPHTSSCDLLLSFFDSSHPNGYEVVLIVVSICISLMVSDVKYLFMDLMTICIFSS